MKTVKLVTFSDGLEKDFVFEVSKNWLQNKLSNMGVTIKHFLSECTHYDTDEIYKMASAENVILTCKEIEAEI